MALLPMAQVNVISDLEENKALSVCSIAIYR
jgi:hypothetical protein